MPSMLCVERMVAPREIVVDGVPVKLWHKGYYECSICNEKGHTKDFHKQVRKAKENNVKRQTPSQEEHKKIAT